jgi:PAS domain S-box-containing protein
MPDSTILSDAVAASIIDAAVVGILVADVSTKKIRYANAALCAMLGYSPPELSQMPVKDIHPAEDLSPALASFESIAKGETSQARSVPCARKDRTVFYADINGFNLTVGASRCVVQFFADTTERKRAEDALRLSEEKFRELVNFLPLTIYEASPDGWFTFVNPRGLEWFGYAEADLSKGIHIFQTISEQDRPRSVENFRVVMSSGESAPHEYLAIRKDGSTFPVLLHSSRMMKDGRLAGIRGIVMDISERKFVENSIQNAMKLESLGILAGGIAHDFNNMLTGIFGHLSMARVNLASGTEARENIDKAISVYGRAKALTQQLLTFAKGGVPAKQRISVSGILKDTVTFALSGSTISAAFDIPDDLWQCDADASQIGQVIDNIVINARQAMPGGGTIAVTAGNVPEGLSLPPPLPNRSFVKIAIRDSGPGIPPNILPRIFDPFFTTKRQGSGLGLATAYSIVKKHDGHILAESKTGEGTVFAIYLPASPADRDVRMPHARPAADSTPAAPCRVLLMDDEQSILAIGSKSLGDIGCTVTTAGEGGEAADLFRTAFRDGKPFDVVVLDLTVPGGKGGRQALDEMKNVDPSVRAVATSGYSDDPVMSDPCVYGFTAKLAKPYLMEDLQKTVVGIALRGEAALRRAKHAEMPPAQL